MLLGNPVKVSLGFYDPDRKKAQQAPSRCIFFLSPRPLSRNKLLDDKDCPYFFLSDKMIE